MTEHRWLTPSRDGFVRVTGEMAMSSAVTAVLWAAILSWRLSGYDQANGLLHYWVPLTAVALPPSAVLIVLLRSAVHGTNILWPSPGARARRTTFLALSAILAPLGWLVLGAGLSAFTHHRGLGATTFAFLGAGWLALALLVGARLTSLVHRSSIATTLSRLAVLLASVTVVAFLALLIRSRAIDPSSSAYAHMVLDVALLFAIAALSSRLRLRNAGLRVVVPAILVVIVAQGAIGIGSLSRLVESESVTKAHAIVVSPIINLIGHPDTKAKQIHKAVIR